MKNKILAANLCLFLIFSVVIATSGDAESAGSEESVLSVNSVEEVNDLEYDDKSEDENSVIVEREKDHPNKFHGITRDVDPSKLNNSAEDTDYKYPLDSKNNTEEEGNNSNGGFIQSIQDFLGWAGSNIQDFLGWAGSNIYSASASLGIGTIVLLLVVLLIAMVYAGIKI